MKIFVIIIYKYSVGVIYIY